MDRENHIEDRVRASTSRMIERYAPHRFDIEVRDFVAVGVSLRLGELFITEDIDGEVRCKIELTPGIIL